ncbi:transglycosylase domain-containing protein [Thermosediminibacter oceani]|uniref:Penicillin-binding protein 1A n=1 Tax=Thermosediminibacter oceani (strain ATCC BAA-1034 / DSM 16646 / JW/IW-1228P) TaxID=555079 RepID=D9RXS1_THEOJ|nr:penicillin-binding protein 1A [Thermosediminibacter oceani]ADL08145.1 penicillin-binding protein, 1A family [Thermosediminibacter oceani DSM 16646]
MSNNTGKRKLSLYRSLLFLALFFVLASSGVALGLFIYYVKDTPPFDPQKLKPSETSIVYDTKGKVIAELHGEQNRIPVPLSEIPEHLKQAFIAIEDQYFYEHKGINFRSLIGALWTDIIRREYHRGASTITQQLVKNAFLTHEKTLKRKAQEAWLAIQLERHFTKDQILEFYLNQIYFGHSAYGVEAAAQTYFGKSVKDLTLAESAMLAGITKGPSLYSPYLNFDRAKERQAVILNAMVEMGFITKEEAENAKKEKINLIGLKNAKADYKAPYFTDYVVTQLAQYFQKELGMTEDEAYKKIYNGGLKIYTTVDMEIQEAAEKALANPKNYPYTKEDKNGLPQPQAAAVVIDPHTGYIKALVGGREHYKRLGLNRASQSYRQPGSAFKPIVVYTAAIDMGYTAATVVDDSPVSYGSWSPQNYTHNFNGLTTIREAIADSVNVVAVKVLKDIGIDRGIEYAQKLGIKSLVLEGRKNDRQLSIALGGLTKGVTPLELASAYGTLANQGTYVEPTAILKVVDKNGRTLLENNPDRWAAVSPQVAFIVTDMMRSVITEGTATRLAGLPFPVAGKTGTTSDNKDVWFVGYTPHLVAAVWMGHDEPAPMRGVAGGYQPALIWKQIMTVAHKNLPRVNFPKPSNIVGPIAVCEDSGKIPTELCYRDPRGPRIRGEYFIKGTEPTEFCDVHVEKLIDVSTGLLATPYCPPDQVQSKVFLVRPPYKASASGKIPLDAKYQPPTEYCNVHGPGSINEGGLPGGVIVPPVDQNNPGNGNGGGNNSPGNSQDQDQGQDQNQDQDQGQTRDEDRKQNKDDNINNNRRRSDVENLINRLLQ